MFKESGLCFNIYLRQCTHNTFVFSIAIKVVNRIQKLRKKAGLEPTDLVEVFIKPHDADKESLEKILNSRVYKIKNILVTPMGALSIIVSAVLAHCVLDEKLHKPGWIGCILCIVSSAIIALYAPKEREIESVKQIWHYATQPGFLVYCSIIIIVVLVLIFRVAPRYGQKQILVYISVCSLMGSLTVMSAKAFGIALNLSVLSKKNQFVYFQTWFFIFVVIGFVVVQLIYLNKENGVKRAECVAAQILCVAVQALCVAAQTLCAVAQKNNAAAQAHGWILRICADVQMKCAAAQRPHRAQKVSFSTVSLFLDDLYTSLG